MMLTLCEWTRPGGKTSMVSQRTDLLDHLEKRPQMVDTQWMKAMVAVLAY